MVSKLLTKCEQILIPLRRAIPVDQAVIITMMAHLEESIVAISRIQDLLKATPATVPLHLILSRKTRIDDYIIGAWVHMEDLFNVFACPGTHHHPNHRTD